MHRVLTCLIVAVLPALAAAQSIYKVLMPDGSVLFTDAPPPGSKVLEEREAKSAPKAPPRAPRPTPAGVPGTSGEVPTTSVAAKERALDAAMREIASAENSLQTAKRNLELGREPLPGERLGLAGGGSRLSPEYEARIAGLERDVATAEARVQKAYAARNAAR